MEISRELALEKKKKVRKANAFNRTIGRNIVVLLNISTS